MSKLYEIWFNDISILEIEVTRFTESSYFRKYAGKEIRSARENTYTKTFETREAAVEFILSQCERRLRIAKHQVEVAESELANFKKAEGL